MCCQRALANVGNSQCHRGWIERSLPLWMLEVGDARRACLGRLDRFTAIHQSMEGELPSRGSYCRTPTRWSHYQSPGDKGVQGHPPRGIQCCRQAPLKSSPCWWRTGWQCVLGTGPKCGFLSFLSHLSLLIPPSPFVSPCLSLPPGAAAAMTAFIVCQFPTSFPEPLTLLQLIIHIFFVCIFDNTHSATLSILAQHNHQD